MFSELWSQPHLMGCFGEVRLQSGLLRFPLIACLAINPSQTLANDAGPLVWEAFDQTSFGETKLSIGTSNLHSASSLLLFAALFCSFVDLLITTYFVNKYGVDCEQNILLKFIIKRIGLIGFWAFWLAIWAWFFFGAQMRPLQSGALLLFIVMIVINNIVQLIRQRRMNMEDE